MRSPNSPAALSRSSEESTDYELPAPALVSRTNSTANLNARRGGYMDSGGYTASGEVPQAPPVQVAGERQLRAEVDGLIRHLNADVEWTRRIEALLRLEGLVRGGAASVPGFLELLKTLQDPIVVQLLDRRSAVSRQACHLVSVLAENMGTRLEPLAMAFLPALFKVVVITVQIMAESADACVRALLRHCQSPRLLPRLCSTLCKDRSAKLRQSAAEYLIQVLEEWDSAALDKAAGAIEEAVLAAAQDAVADTRTAGRAAFAAYCRARPERLHPLLARQGPGLQQKLRDALVAYVPGSSGAPGTVAAAAGPGAAAAPAAKLPARRHSALPVPPSGALRRASVKPSAAGARFSIAGPALAAAAAEAAEAAAAERSAAPLLRRPPANSRKSVGGAALRVTLPVRAHDGDMTARNDYAPSRIPAASSAQDSYDRASEYGGSSHGLSSLSSVSEAWGGEQQHSVPLSQLLQAFSGAGSDWKAKSDAFAALEEAMQRADIAHSIVNHLDRFVTVFLESISEAHVRVAVSCLRCLHAALGACGALLERHLDRLVPPLLVRAADGKEAIRRAAADALSVLPGVVSADVFLSTLSAAVGGARSTKAQIAAIETFTAVAPLLQDIGPHALRAWASCMAAAAQDKHKEVRRAAEVALSAIHRHLDAGTVTDVLSSEPADAQAGLLRNLRAMSVSDRQPQQPSAQPFVRRLAERPPDPTAAASSGSASPPRPFTPGFASAGSSEGSPSDDRSAAVEAAAGHAAVPGPAAAADHAAAAPAQRHVSMTSAPTSAQRENAGGAVAPSPKALTPSPPQRQLSAASAPMSSPLVDVSNLPTLPSPCSQQGTASPLQQFATPAALAHSTLFPVASPALTPPTAFRKPRPHFATADDARVFLEELVEGLQSPDPAVSLAALPGLVAAIPTFVWQQQMPQVLKAVGEAARFGELEARKHALTAVHAFACEAAPVLAAHFADVAPLLLDCACDTSREVRLLAQQAMDACMTSLPVRGCCLEPLLQRCGQEAESLEGEAAALQALFRGMSQLVRRLGPGEADALLGTPLLPCLVRAFGHASADVRKAVVFCLVELRLAVDESKLAPVLAELSTTQQKLLAIYVERTQQQQQQAQQQLLY